MPNYKKFLNPKITLYVSIVSLILVLCLTPFVSLYLGIRTITPEREDQPEEYSRETPAELPHTGWIIKNINNFEEEYDYPPLPQAAGTVRIPILVYHHIDTLPSSNNTRPYYVSPAMFEKQMEYLSDKGYKTLTPTEFYELLKSGRNPTQKSVMLTFDDGNYDNYKYAFPVLKEYGFVGIFYVVTSKLGIPVKALKEMSSAGMVIESHSSTHMALQDITDDEILTKEITSSKLTIQSITGKNVISFCYPGCGANSQTAAKVASSGYLFAVSCGKTIDHRFSQRYSLSRMHVYNNFENFKRRLSGIYEVTYDYSE